MPDAKDVETLVAPCRANGRVCPTPPQWSALWELLEGHRRVGDGWEPPLPLILAGWWASSNLDKMLRLEEHIRWADAHGQLGAVSAFLEGLPEVEWHHLKD